MIYDEKLAFLRRYRDAQRTMRRLQKAGALALQPEVPRLESPRVDLAEPSGNDFLADATERPRRHKRKE